MITLKKATEADVDDIAKLHQELDKYNIETLGLKDLFYALDVNNASAYIEMTRDILNDEGTVAFVAEENGSCLGYALATLQPKKFGDGRLYATLEYILVKPEARGKGVGEKLLEVIESELKERGVLAVSSFVFTNNDISLNFHKKHGFKVIAQSYELLKSLN